jgi:hypothetical protein
MFCRLCGQTCFAVCETTGHWLHRAERTWVQCLQQCYENSLLLKTLHTLILHTKFRWPRGQCLHKYITDMSEFTLFIGPSTQHRKKQECPSRLNITAKQARLQMIHNSWRQIARPLTVPLIRRIWGTAARNKISFSVVRSTTVFPLPQCYFMKFLSNFWQLWRNTNATKMRGMRIWTSGFDFFSNKLLSLSMGFWTLSFVQCSKNWKIQRFGDWVCFLLQRKGKRHLFCWIP